MNLTHLIRQIETSFKLRDVFFKHREKNAVGGLNYARGFSVGG